MSYYDSAKGIRITKERALQELALHGVVDTQDFFAEVGNHEYYEAKAVLRWLGY